jgi:hypothetical protein
MKCAVVLGLLITQCIPVRLDGCSHKRGSVAGILGSELPHSRAAFDTGEGRRLQEFPTVFATDLSGTGFAEESTLGQSFTTKWAIHRFPLATQV